MFIKTCVYKITTVDHKIIKKRNHFSFSCDQKNIIRQKKNKKKLFYISKSNISAKMSKFINVAAIRLRSNTNGPFLNTTRSYCQPKGQSKEEIQKRLEEMKVTRKKQAEEMEKTKATSENLRIGIEKLDGEIKTMEKEIQTTGTK